MKIIYGTKNNGKIISMRKCLKKIKQEHNIELIGLNELNEIFPEVEEDGNDPLENARIKAAFYYGLLKQPIFSLDSGLYFDGLPDHLQPGLNIRRVNNNRLNDVEMIHYYSNLAKIMAVSL